MELIRILRDEEECVFLAVRMGWGVKRKQAESQQLSTHLEPLVVVNDCVNFDACFALPALLRFESRCRYHCTQGYR